MAATVCKIAVGDYNGGESGIRIHGRLITVSSFQDYLLKPLGHLPIGTPYWTQTSDLLLRRQLLYSTELKAYIWWTIKASNLGPTGYEPVALTN